MDKLIEFLPVLIIAAIVIGKAIHAAQAKAQQEQQRQARPPSAGGAPLARPASPVDAELREFLQKVTGAVPQRPPTTRPQPSRPVRGPARAPARDVSGDIERALGGTATPRRDLGAALPSQEKRAAARRTPVRPMPRPARPSRDRRPKRAADRRAKRPARKPAAKSAVRRLVTDAPVAEPAQARKAAPTQPSAVSPALSMLSELQRAIVMAEILDKPIALRQPREF